MAKIGILGGTFNPIHKGHISMAEAAFHGATLDEVWLLPSGIPPHKQAMEATATDRFEMCKLAAECASYIQVKDFEQCCLLPNYSYKTLQFLVKRYPEHQFYFIIGEDSLRYFHEWKKPEIISACADVIVVARTVQQDAPKGSISYEVPLEQVILDANKKFPGSFMQVPMEMVNISSSELREKLKKGKGKKYLDKRVYEYIQEHFLYRELPLLPEVKPIMKQIKENVKFSRYLHILGVMDTAANLAMRYSYPVEMARMAGLLHDCAKHLTGEEQIKYCEEHHIKISDVEKKAPQLLHAKTGAHMAKTVYGIQNEEILHAILVHTTGCIEMSLLDKIVFVADYIEPSRNRAPRLAEIRQAAYMDLDYTVSLILYDTLYYLKEQGQVLDETTMETYRYYKQKRKEQHSDLTLEEKIE